jgi:nicotinate-nucleotide adenylyltransferase
VTIESIQRDFPGRPLVWIMGEDQLQAFTTWHRWEWLVQSMALAVCTRPRADEARSSSKKRQATLAAAPPGARILPVAFEADAVSSSQVREAIGKGLPIDVLVPQAVARFLETHPVYAAGSAARPRAQ